MKNKAFITLTLLCLGITTVAQVGIGTDAPHDAAILEIQSTDKGILLPRLESSKISSLGNVQGLMVYCTDCRNANGVLKINNGSEWVDYVPLNSSGGTSLTSGAADQLDLRNTNFNSSAQFAQLTFYQGADQRAAIWHDNPKKELGINVNTGETIIFTIGQFIKFRINGNGYFGYGISAANGFYNYSDQRWKNEIKPLDNSLNKIAALRGVSYEWKRDEFPDKNFSKGTQIGLIAQEVEEVFPELVHTEKEGYKSVSYSNLVAPLIEAVKELKEQNENFRIRIESLEAELKNQNN